MVKFCEVSFHGNIFQELFLFFFIFLFLLLTFSSCSHFSYCFQYSIFFFIFIPFFVTFISYFLFLSTFISICFSNLSACEWNFKHLTIFRGENSHFIWFTSSISFGDACYRVPDRLFKIVKKTNNTLQNYLTNISRFTNSTLKHSLNVFHSSLIFAPFSLLINPTLKSSLRKNRPWWQNEIDSQIDTIWDIKQSLS